MLERVKVWFWSMFCPERFVRHLVEEELRATAEENSIDDLAKAFNGLSEAFKCHVYDGLSYLNQKKD